MERTRKINDYIRSLEYDRDEIIAFNGNKVSKIEPKSQSIDDNGTYYVITRSKRTLENNFDVMVPSNNFDATFPGALLYVNKNLIDGTPQTISVDRGKIKLTMNLPGMTSNNTREIIDTEYSSVLAAMNEILNDWYENYDRHKVPAMMNYEGCSVYDDKSLQLKFGCDVQSKLGIDFSMLKSQKKNLYIVRFSQVFYNASIEPITNPADAFAESVTVEELIEKNVNADTPPAYIKSVAYGRQIYIKFESTCSASELAAAINGTVNVQGVNVTGEASAKYADVFKNTTCSFVVMGGSAEHSGRFSMTDNMSAINEAIFADVELSETNPAVPLTYKVHFLKDGILAKFCGTTEYVEETIEKFTFGEIVLEHSGAYIANFEVYWDEIQGYDKDGKPNIVRKCWEDNGKNRTAGYKATIVLTGNCRNVEVRARHNDGLVWNDWIETFHAINLPIVPKRYIKIWGTTLNAEASNTISNE